MIHHHHHIDLNYSTTNELVMRRIDIKLFSCINCECWSYNCSVEVGSMLMMMMMVVGLGTPCQLKTLTHHPTLPPSQQQQLRACLKSNLYFLNKSRLITITYTHVQCSTAYRSSEVSYCTAEEVRLKYILKGCGITSYLEGVKPYLYLE